MSLGDELCILYLVIHHLFEQINIYCVPYACSVSYILRFPYVHRMNSSQVRNKIHVHYYQPSEFHHSLLEAHHILMDIPPQSTSVLRRRRDEEELDAAILALLIPVR